MTALFADIRGFTALTQEQGPELATRLVTELYQRSTQIVVRHDGIMDKFLGDGFLAFFNVPIHREDHVAMAVSVAQEIQALVPEINKEFGEAHLLNVGIGVASGMAYASLIGSEDCKDYTVMGDTVNIGSRLQAVAASGEIVVSGDAYAKVRDAYPDASQRSVTLKGIKGPVEVYSLTETQGRPA